MAKTTLPAGDDLKSDADADEVDPSDAELERGDREAETWEVADAADDDTDDDSDEDEKALDELEAEELEMLTEDEAAEKLVVTKPLRWPQSGARNWPLPTRGTIERRMSSFARIASCSKSPASSQTSGASSAPTAPEARLVRSSRDEIPPIARGWMPDLVPNSITSPR